MMSTIQIIKNYVIAILLGIIVGFKIIPPTIIGIIFLILIAKTLYHFSQNDLGKVFSTLPYVIYLEIFIRSYARFIPYLSVQYLMMLGFGYLLLSGSKTTQKLHFKPVFLILIYFSLEILNGFFPSSLRMTSSLQLQTFCLVVVGLWAAHNKLNDIILNIMMDHIRIATLFLAGVVLVAHLQGKIDYSSASSSAASNDMAPVQLSGYFGTGLSLVLISILNAFDKRSKIVQMVAFCIIAIIMILTFSRGGVYFVGSVALIYMYSNRIQLGSYFKFLILIPIGLILFNFIVARTDGKVIDRYEEKGASNRENLVLIAFYIFSEHPVIGIGTGNFNLYIKEKNLFQVDSGVHNEFARAAAEHGIIGVIVYWSFFIALFITILKRQRPARDFALYFFTLFFLITIHNGLKISIQPLMLILAIAIAPINLKNKKVSLIHA